MLERQLLGEFDDCNGPDAADLPSTTVGQKPDLQPQLPISMKSALSVNAALDGLATLVGQDIALVGILRFEFEGTALDHFPKSERRNAEDDGPLEPSSVWLSVGSGALQFNEEQLRRWHGKRVTVLGTLLGPDEKLGGCGHFSAFPAEVLARSIERL
ncbi:hypothetical protein [Variovorax sp. 770b2]|uniref:hypothetical protein n=1 Tax=Variovorax sp. 770b2 TaxID=1566271 RepID=UPI0011608973|nr:hypothetical protein [Variovorax sp. 770b2]